MDATAEPLTFAKLLEFTSDWLWGMPLLVLLIGGGLFFTIYSRFVPFLYLPHSIQILRGKFSDPNDPAFGGYKPERVGFSGRQTNQSCPPFTDTLSTHP